MVYSYVEVLVYIASLAGKEGPYEESNQKAVVPSKKEGDYSYQCYGIGCLIKKKMENWHFL